MRSDRLSSESVSGERGQVNAFDQFLDEIGRHALLSPADEVKLAKRIERGDKAARDQLIVGNLRLVVYVAKRFRAPGIPLADLVQEGMLGLIRAVDDFDWRRDCRFSTYAIWWIRRAVLRGGERLGATIRLPENVSAELRELRGAESRELVRLQRQPTGNEVAVAAGFPPGRLEDLRRLDTARVAVCEHAESEVSLIEGVASPVTTDEEVIRRSVAHQVQRALIRMPPLERDVITLRYGIDGGPSRTVAAVGAELGLTYGQVRKLERLGLRRLSLLPDLMGLAA